MLIACSTDGILVANNLERKDITHLIDEPDGKFVAKIVRRRVPINNATDVLGWIKFDENTGIVELTNLRAQLSRSFLDIGCSTKKNSKGLAGAHGEGAKAGALVLVREGYGVVYDASGFNWRFFSLVPRTFKTRSQRPDCTVA
jgi:hypothetical protein